MFVQFFESFTKITGFVEALSTSSFTALYCSVNFWILQKFPFFLICSFHKNHRFYLHFYCVSLMQWIFKCFVIFAKSVCKPGHISLDHFSATQLQLVIYGTLDPARKLAVCILVVELYPNKTKTKTTRQVRQVYLFYYYFVSLFICKAVSMESTWWSALQNLTSKCQACESNRTLLFKRWIHSHSSLD